MTTKIQYVTPEKLELLKKELHELKTIRRRETALKIETAKALGDLSENAEYHEAKDEMAFIEGRIMEIGEIMKNISIIEEGGSSTIVRIGSTINIDVQGKRKQFTIVGSNEADPVNGRISNESPLGNAFLGRSVHERVEVSTPGGVQIYTIVSIS